MEFHRRRTPGGEGPAGLAAGQTERARHRLRIKAAQAADRGGGAKRSEHPRPMEAARAEGGVVRADADARGDFEPGRQGDKQVAA